MPDVKQITFTHKELTELMLKDRGISSGHWQILIAFKLVGGNVGLESADPNPAAITLIDRIGIQQVDQPTPLSIDASKLGSESPSGRPGRTAKSPTSSPSR